MITFWTFPYGLDNRIVIQSGVNCVQNVPKFWIHFGHFHAMGTYFEQCAVIVQTTVKSLDTFLGIINQFGHILSTFWAQIGVWSHFGHIMDTFGGKCVQNVTIPTSCCSADCFGQQHFISKLQFFGLSD